MFDTGHRDSIVQRGIAEARACRDMLELAPVHPSLLHRVLARISAAIRELFPRREPEQHGPVVSPALDMMR